MADTIRTEAALIALLANNGSRAINAQVLRDVLVSVLGVVPYVAKTANYTATENDEFIACDATGGAITINLPAVAAVRSGKRFVVKKVDSGGNAVTLDGNSSEQIEGSTTLAFNVQYEAAVIVNTGAKWLVESHYIPA